MRKKQVRSSPKFERAVNIVFFIFTIYTKKAWSKSERHKSYQYNVWCVVCIINCLAERGESSLFTQYVFCVWSFCELKSVRFHSTSLYLQIMLLDTVNTVEITWYQPMWRCNISIHIGISVFNFKDEIPVLCVFKFVALMLCKCKWKRSYYMSQYWFAW